MSCRAFVLVLLALGALILADFAVTGASAHDIHGQRHAPATAPSTATPKPIAAFAGPAVSRAAGEMEFSLQHESDHLAMGRHVEILVGARPGSCLPEGDGCAEGCCSTVCHVMGLTSAAAPVGGPLGRTVHAVRATTELLGEDPASITRPPNRSL